MRKLMNIFQSCCGVWLTRFHSESRNILSRLYVMVLGVLSLCFTATSSSSSGSQLRDLSIARRDWGNSVLPEVRKHRANGAFVVVSLYQRREFSSYAILLAKKPIVDSS
uniref:Uncharacterized protein n=1 Tax=Candida corydali TaxID=391826 RepID=S5U628_9ASCO|nr:hypothetical protein [Candida corydali]AGS44546.1 hypothetical protein [Candida corydali]